MLQYSDINNYKQNLNDSGSTSFQVCLLTNKVIKLTEHLKIHRKDFASQRGLWRMLGQRKQLLKYLVKKNPQEYEKLICSLGIRGLKFN
jgi:small subunit ribosomal protein S15